jgi:Bacterial Ig-like domain
MAWAFTPSALTDGSHTIVASEMDAAGNTGTASLTFAAELGDLYRRQSPYGAAR